MTASKRLALALPVLLLALAVSAALASAALAADEVPSAAECQEWNGDHPNCPEDQCPALEGYQASSASCPAPQQPAQPAEQPAPTDACPEVEGVQSDASQCLPDEAPAPGIDIEASSLTIETVQHDNPATIGGEQEYASPTAVSAGGTSAAVATPSGDLPYTGLSTIHVAIIAVSLLWAGALAWFVGATSRRAGAGARA